MGQALKRGLHFQAPLGAFFRFSELIYGFADGIAFGFANVLSSCREVVNHLAETKKPPRNFGALQKL